MTSAYPLRPFLPSDVDALRELYVESIEELTADEYDEDQRIAWAMAAADGAAFARRLASATTLVIEVAGEPLGFASLDRSGQIDMLYVQPEHAGEGVGSALLDALERLAAGRGLKKLNVDASETASGFFATKGYVATRRNVTPMAGEWLATTTMEKPLA